MRVVMFQPGSLVHDARVTREARTLAAAGYDVTVLGVLARGEDLPATETLDGYRIERLTISGGLFDLFRRRIGGGGERGGGRASAGGVAPARAWRSYLVKLGRTVSAIRYNRRAARRAVELRPAAYHCNDFNTLWAGVWAARRAPGAVVYDSHEIYAHLNVERPLPGRRWFVELAERRLLRRVAATIVVTESFADHLVARYGIARPTVVMNIPDPPAETPEVAVPEPLRREGVRIIYIGGIQRARGIEQAIEALAYLPQDHSVVLMGPGFPADERRLRALASDLGLTDRVSFVPPVPIEAVTAVAAHASVAVVPFQASCLSHRLTLPNKIFEAMHAGLPIVASDFPEFRRVVEGTGAGRVCNASDPRALAETIGSITADAGAMEQMRAAARAGAATYTWQREAAKLLAVYGGVEAARPEPSL